MTQKSFVGVDYVYIAPVTQDDMDAYAAGAPSLLALAMNVSAAPKTASKTQYAGNKPFDLATAEGESELEFEIPGLSLKDQAYLLGRVYDAVNGRMYDNGGTPPELAVGFRADISGGDRRFYWYLKGQFEAPSEEQATKTDSPDFKTTKLKFTALRTIHEFDLDGGTTTDSVKRVTGETTDPNFDEATWFDNVQVPAPGAAPAFTATPAPVDGAIGQAVDVAITVTFSNPLAGGAERGIGLLREDTEAAIAVTRSISADRKVVTLAHAALAAATTYLITVNGVTDLYGQALADAVYDFTTA